ncbi:hypothetical protein QBC39DRAFT_418369 [Podospora conica]|nr:hypothetical protein QBC39DRAFT_418369 [Schizothecium conicum]
MAAGPRHRWPRSSIPVQPDAEPHEAQPNPAIRQSHLSSPLRRALDRGDGERPGLLGNKQTCVAQAFERQGGKQGRRQVKLVRQVGARGPKAVDDGVVPLVGVLLPVRLRRIAQRTTWRSSRPAVLCSLRTMHTIKGTSGFPPRLVLRARDPRHPSGDPARPRRPRSPGHAKDPRGDCAHRHRQGLPPALSRQRALWPGGGHCLRGRVAFLLALVTRLESQYRDAIVPVTRRALTLGAYDNDATRHRWCLLVMVAPSRWPHITPTTPPARQAFPTQRLSDGDDAQRFRSLFLALRARRQCLTRQFAPWRRSRPLAPAPAVPSRRNTHDNSHDSRPARAPKPSQRRRPRHAIPHSGGVLPQEGRTRCRSISPDSRQSAPFARDGAHTQARGQGLGT